MQNVKEQVQKILVDNSLDFTIEKQPMFVMSNGQQIQSPYFGLLNTKTGEVLHSVKESYRVSQTDEVVEMVLRGIEPFGGQLNVSKAGAINGGRKVYIQLEVEGDAKVGDDTIKKYVTILDSNDGSAALSIGIGDLTMSCQNQFYKFYKKSDAKFMHSVSLSEKIKTIPSLLKIALEESMKQIHIYNKFVSTPASKELADKLVKYVIGFDRTSVNVNEHSMRSINSMNTLYSHIEKEMNQKGKNMWGLHSGITSWTTHDKSAPKRDNGRLESLIAGSNYAVNMKSFDFALEQSGQKVLEFA